MDVDHFEAVGTEIFEAVPDARRRDQYVARACRHSPVVQREALTIPVAARAEVAKLLEDASAVFFLPLPDLFKKGIAPKLFAGLSLFLVELAFDDGLRRDPSVVGAWSWMVASRGMAGRTSGAPSQPPRQARPSVRPVPNAPASR